MKRTVEERHTITMSERELLDALKKANVVPYEVADLESVSFDGGDEIEIVWTVQKESE